METLTRLATASGEERIVRLVEVIIEDPRGMNHSADVWFVLQPVCR